MAFHEGLCSVDYHSNPSLRIFFSCHSAYDILQMPTVSIEKLMGAVGGLATFDMGILKRVEIEGARIVFES